MVFRKKETLGVFDIEGNIIKVAIFNAEDNHMTLRSLTAVRTQDAGIPGLTKAMRVIVNDHKLAGSRAVVVVPRYKVTLKNLKLPSIIPSEIENMVSLQAVKHLPFVPEKIVSTYRVLGRDENGYSDIMMALVHRDAINSILAVFDESGIAVERLTLGSEALSLWHSSRKKDAEKDLCICLADIGASFLEIQVIRKGLPEFSRSINFSSTSDMESRLVEEVRKSLLTYVKTSSGTEVDKLMLTGRRSLLKKEAPLLKKNIGLPMVYVDAAKQCPKSVDAKPAKPEDLSDMSFTAAIATGLNLDKLQTNFMPKEIREKRLSKITKESLVITTTLFLCVLLGIAGITTKKFIDKKKYLSLINMRLKETEPKVKHLSKIKNATKIIRQQINLTGSVIDILRELYGKVPKGISLTIFDYEDGNACLVRGASQRLSDVFKFVSILEDSKYFNNVKVRYATKRVIAQKEFTDFEIICQLTENGTL